MSILHRFATVAMTLAALFVIAVGPHVANAGVSEAVLALAPPLAEQFGVPASSVTKLLEDGMSLDSVTELLLVGKSSETGLDDVKKIYDESGQTVEATAKKLDVAVAEYSPERVKDAISEATAKAQADATTKAGDAASDAVGSALGGLMD